VPPAFWVLSLAGGAVLLGYAVHRRDPVYIAGQSGGLLIYWRNLWLNLRAGAIERNEAPHPETLLPRWWHVLRSWDASRAARGTTEAASQRAARDASHDLKTCHHRTEGDAHGESAKPRPAS
jgi:hypothetical protein